MKVIGKFAGIYLDDVVYTYLEVLPLREDAEESTLTNRPPLPSVHLYV
jgi:hypothetical protein